MSRSLNQNAGTMKKLTRRREAHEEMTSFTHFAPSRELFSRIVAGVAAPASPSKKGRPRRDESRRGQPHQPSACMTPGGDSCRLSLSEFCASHLRSRAAAAHKSSRVTPANHTISGVTRGLIREDQSAYRFAFLDFAGDFLAFFFGLFALGMYPFVLVAEQIQSGET
jgi:hypothetical protein